MIANISKLIVLRAYFLFSFLFRELRLPAEARPHGGSFHCSMEDSPCICTFGLSESRTFPSRAIQIRVAQSPTTPRKELYYFRTNVLNLQVTRSRRYNPAANSVIYSPSATVGGLGDPLAVNIELKSARTRDRSLFVLICTTVFLTLSIMFSIC